MSLMKECCLIEKRDTGKAKCLITDKKERLLSRKTDIKSCVFNVGCSVPDLDRRVFVGVFGSVDSVCVTWDSKVCLCVCS